VSKDLYIHVGTSDVSIALVENKKLVELQKEKHDNQFSVGDLYLGKVKKLVPGLNAAFVDVGAEKDAFLHYLDLGPKLLSLQKYVKDTITGKQQTAFLNSAKLLNDIDKNGKIDEVLESGQQILVQIAKEPISTKGPRINCEVSLAGRYIVLVPFSDRISISQRIKSREERERLKNLIKSIKPNNFGVIIRTVAENRKVADLDADMKSLVDKWQHCYKQMNRANAPKRVLGEMNRTNTILRDLLNPSFTSIHVDSQKMYDEVCNYIKSFGADKTDMVKLYKGKMPLFEFAGIEKQIRALFGKNVSMQSGAYLVVEHTEALHVVDVNSGNTSQSKETQEANALRVNLEAAEEIARQLRLRDLGGIIVIDFIDLHKTDNRKILLDKMREFMKNDRAKHQVLPPSKFGLVQITRQRVRPEMDIKTTEEIPITNGKMEVPPTILIIDDIENRLKFIMNELQPSSVSIMVHPFIEAYLKAKFLKFQRKWFKEYKKWVSIDSMVSINLWEYHFYNAKGEKLNPA
jgi:ribonuclease G